MDSFKETLTHIQNIKKLQGSNEKICYLKKLVGNKVFEKLLYYTYNTFYVYYVSKKSFDKMVKHHPLDSNKIGSFYDLFELLDNLNKRLYTGNSALEQIQKFLNKSDVEAYDLLKLIIERNLDCGVSTGLIEKVWGKNFIPSYNVALASGEEHIKHIKYPAMSQLKGDGRRLEIHYKDKNDIIIKLRSGDVDEKLTNFKPLIEFIQDHLISGYVYDGEAIMIDEMGNHIARKISNGLLARKELTFEQLNNIRILCWDMITCEDFERGYSVDFKEEYDNRFKRLINVFENKIYRPMLNSRICDYFLILIDYKYVNNIHEAREHAKYFINNNYEGSILKNIHVPYEGKRTKNMIKIKSELETDLIVTNFVYGTGILSNYMGALTCESSDGLLEVSVGSGFSHEDRGLKLDENNNPVPIRNEKMCKENIIGKIITVKYNELIQNETTKKYSLFLPRFEELRLDKTEADSLIKIKSEQVKK